MKVSALWFLTDTHESVSIYEKTTVYLKLQYLYVWDKDTPRIRISQKKQYNS